MKKVIIILAIILALSSIALADQQILSNMVQLTVPENGSVRVAMEGGSQFDFQCEQGKTAKYNLTITKDITCVQSYDNGTCLPQIGEFTSKFSTFTDSYAGYMNDTWKSCTTLASTNRYLKEKLAEDNNKSRTLQNQLDAYLQEYQYNQTSLFTMYDEAQQKYVNCASRAPPSCTAEKEECKKSKTLWAIIGAVLGGLAVYIYFFRKETTQVGGQREHRR